MSGTLTEISGVFLRERFRRDEWAIIDIRPTSTNSDLKPANNLVACKGNCDPDELKAGLEYRFYGTVEHHAKYGDSFAFKTFVLPQPHERGGVIRYLQQAPHVGTATANVLWSKFKGQAVRVLRESPDVAAAAVRGQFTEAKAKEAAAKLQELAALEETTIDLMDLLDGRGFPKATARESIKTYGNRAPEMIRKNPYLLMQYRGCGFLRTDCMYLDLGHPPARLKRQALAIWHSLASDVQGHTWYSAKSIEDALRAKVSAAAINPLGAARLACRHGMVSSYRDVDGSLWFAEGKKAKQEAYVAEKIAAAAQEVHEWPVVEGTAEDDGRPSIHQASEWAKSAGAGAVFILGGSPGTGKTFLSAHVIKEFLGSYGRADILVAAPTGKAAVRIGELMQQYGVSLPARTIHSMLGVESVDGGNWTFRHNEYNPLPARLIVVDEASMLGTGLFAHLIAARDKGCKLLLVGDTNQLPPVEHGAPLRDLIAAGVPCGELRKIRRNAGSIVRACAHIRDNEEWQPDEQLDMDGDVPKNLKLLHAANGQHALAIVVDLLKKIRDGGLADPVWDCQVLVAVNRKSSLARKQVNEVLQAEFNKSEQIGDTPFRLDDKVIQLKNALLPNAFAWADGPEHHFVSNGDQGRVLNIVDNALHVQFDNPQRIVKITQRKKQAGEENGNGSDDEKSAWGDLDLAYGVTTHKMQGSEQKVIIVLLDEYPGAKMVCDRAWLYTAISRAKKVCFLVGKLGTAYRMCRRTNLMHRKTFLRERIVGHDTV